MKILGFYAELWDKHAGTRTDPSVTSYGRHRKATGRKSSPT
jgi:hypothetical protein